MRMKMKRVFRRNQIIITTLAIMIAAAGISTMRENPICRGRIHMKRGDQDFR